MARQVAGKNPASTMRSSAASAAPARSNPPIGLGFTTPQTMLALQRSAGNRAVTSAPTIQRGRGSKKNRGRSSNISGKPSGSPPTTTPTTTTKPSKVVLPVTTNDVKKTPEVVAQAKQPQGTTQTEAPKQPSRMDYAGEVTGNVVGGTLDVWEGLETVVDTGKDKATRGVGATKVVGGITSVISTMGKHFDYVGENGMDIAGRITETCGFLGALGELVSAFSGWWQSQVGSLELLHKTVGLAAGAMKALDSYLQWSKEEKMFDKWVAKGLIPGVAVVGAAYKIFAKLYEMWTLSSARAKLVEEIDKLKKGKKKRQEQGETATKLVETIDSKWYRALLDVVSSGLELAGELTKWADVTTGWITGNVLTGMSKAVPFTAKILPVGYSIFTGFSSWLWGNGGTTATPNGGTVTVTGEWDRVTNLIKSRRTDPFGKLLCETIGLDQGKAHDPTEIENALRSFAA